MRVLLFILTLFVGIPLFELYWLIEVGSEIGAFSTIALTILTAIIGGYLVRQQGMSTAIKINQSRARGEVPALEMISGLVIFVCGLFLLLPGFFTDTLGFLLLIPLLRETFIVFLLKRFQVIQMQRPIHPTKHVEEPLIIEGEYHRDDV